MTVKTKPRKAPAKAVTPKALPAERLDVMARDVRDIPRLVSRWKWLEADQEYQIDNAATGKESEELQFLHKKELNQIAEKLASANPETREDICCLLDFVAPSFEDGFRSDGADVKIFRNVRDALMTVWNAEMHRYRDEGAAAAERKVRGEFRMLVNHLEWKSKGSPEGESPWRGAA
jgi:hypothetical protein